MVKKLASKTSKELLTDAQINEQNLQQTDFTGTWQGRLCVLNHEKSAVAQKMGIEKEGEFAIKVR